MDLLELIKDLQTRNTYESDIKYLKSGIRILDIGCRNGTYWWNLKHNLAFKNIIGIDKYPIEHFEEEDQGYETNSICIDAFNNFQRRNELNQITTQEEFNQIFDFRQIDIEDFTSHELYLLNHYDLIIISRFLYLFEKPKAQEILNKLIPLIRKSGYVYLYLASENFEHPKYRPKNAPEEKRIRLVLNEEELFGMVNGLSIIHSRLNGQYRDILCRKD